MKTSPPRVNCRAVVAHQLTRSSRVKFVMKRGSDCGSRQAGDVVPAIPVKIWDRMSMRRGIGKMFIVTAPACISSNRGVTIVALNLPLLPSSAPVALTRVG
jgi:hypothetical protein